MSCAVVLLAALGGGCQKPTSDNIQLWKTTQKGPERLHEALADRSVAPRLRGEAAVAMVDIGHSEEVDTLIAQMPADDRAEIGKTLVPAYQAAMQDPGPERSLSYRDALFSLRQYANPEEQKRIDASLLPALEAEFKAGKLRQGRHSIDKMLTAIGSDASAMLVGVLAGDGAYLQAAELLAKIGDEAAREKGAAALVARAPKIKAADKRPELFYKAVGMLGGSAALAFLQEKVTGGSEDEALWATRGLGERRDPAVLAFALRVAGDPRQAAGIRDQMFGVIEGIGGLEAEKGLLGIISSDKDERVRYHAFESVLAVRKVEAIQPALEAFPSSASYKKVDVDDLLVKLIEKLGAPARPALVTTLSSRAPLARMTAVMALEQMGRGPDAEALEKLGKDTAAIKGFPSGDTVGKAALRAAESVKKKS
jgi:HEAT repeat protein